jgi:hypothetical protein
MSEHGKFLFVNDFLFVFVSLQIVFDSDRIVCSSFVLLLAQISHHQVDVLFRQVAFLSQISSFDFDMLELLPVIQNAEFQLLTLFACLEFKECILL